MAQQNRTNVFTEVKSNMADETKLGLQVTCATTLYELPLE